MWGALGNGSRFLCSRESWPLKLGHLFHFVPDLVNLSLNDNDGSSGASDQDTLAPLPGATPWPLLPTFSYQYPAPHPYSPQPPPYHELSSYTYGGGSASSQHSEGKSPKHQYSQRKRIQVEGIQEGQAREGRGWGPEDSWLSFIFLIPSPLQQGAGAVGQQEAMGGPGAQAGLRNGPLSQSPAVAVSLNSPAGEAAFGGVGNLVGLVMVAPLHPGARQAVLLISELFQGSIPTDLPLAWLSPITP